ncbi:hypothetical protein BDA99DRAFT_565553 [Phascolomyces articulosus]|uniref:Uncharacterized protein n=1 Tax=Phascolomyces articulosus TaxID=60185 RepID=A0AAD5P9E3_9FUNG|nr:hypothetical protein BDA99DRAFT_565553 [Phascolomyces articulosus]
MIINKFIILLLLSAVVLVHGAATINARRPCIVGLDDCPEDEECIPQEENYGHCGIP